MQHCSGINVPVLFSLAKLQNIVEKFISSYDHIHLLAAKIGTWKLFPAISFSGIDQQDVSSKRVTLKTWKPVYNINKTVLPKSKVNASR